MDIRVINYSSEGRLLKGLLHTTNIDSTKSSKALVFLHGGFALGYSDITDCQPFIDAGYIVFSPTYRGANGNDGGFEMFNGEVTDAENAVKWLANQPFVHPDSLFVFGHSIGGAMSLHLSMNNNSPSQLNGSSAGLYSKKNLRWLCGSANIPFDVNNDQEYFFRCPIMALDYLPKRHLMFVGEEDGFDEDKNRVNKMYWNNPDNFELIKVPGDHFSSLHPAMNAFLNEIDKLNVNSKNSN